MLLAAAISDSSGWKILAAMLLSELVIEVESATFVEQRYVVQERLKKAAQSIDQMRPIETDGSHVGSTSF